MRLSLREVDHGGAGGQVGAAGLPSFSTLRVPGRAGFGGGRCQAVAGGPVAKTAVPQRGPRVGPGPVRGQVQHPAALRAGEPGGHGDQVAAQGGAAGDGMVRGWRGCRRRGAGCG